MAPSATFDVLGTCFHFTPAIDCIADILKRTSAVSSSQDAALTASSLFHSWFYAAQRDFTYMSLSNSYTPIISVLRQTFRRACYIVGVSDVQNDIKDEDIEQLMGIMTKLPARDGLAKCFETLRAAGWDVVACTNGGRKGSEGYFSNAGISGIEGSTLISCDEIERDGGKGVAKPDARVYDAANKLLDGRARGKEVTEGTRWFVAAHSWDLIAARRAGFRTAWVAHEEGDVCTGLFGEFDIYAQSLAECAEKMVAFKS